MVLEIASLPELPFVPAPVSPDHDALRRFDRAAAAARPEDEARLLAALAGLLEWDMATASGRAPDSVAPGAADLLRSLFPDHGWQWGELPRRGTRPRGLASVWAAGASQMMTFTAATPGLALLRATNHALLRRLERDALRGASQSVRHFASRDPVAQQDRAADS